VIGSPRPCACTGRASATRRRVRAAVLAGLRDVNVPDAERRMREHPHEPSVGCSSA
jgi:ABC-type dipeptide/oligopeptide/nickel transport system ATPase component